MAFATKYRIEGTSDIYGKVTINIKKDGYIGSVINLDGAGRDFVTLKIGSPSNDISSTILPGSASIQYYCKTEFQTIELAQSEVFTFLVEINDSLGDNIWSGWVMPEEYSESYTNTPYLVNIVASDFLDGLKNVQMGSLLTTKTTLFNALRTALAGTRLVLRYLESVSIYADSMDSNNQDSPLTQAEVSVKTFEGLNCYDAINIILKPFFARVYQYRGWRIENITEKRDNYTQRLYNTLGVYQSFSNSLSVVQLDNTSSNFRAFVQKSGNLNFKPALNSASSYFRSIERKSATGLQGFDKLEDWTDSSNLVSWTKVNGITISRVASQYNGSEYAVWIDGKNDSFSDDQYIQSTAISVNPTDNQNINIQFDYNMDYPSVIILGTKPILYVEFFLDATSADYYWTGTQWVTDRKAIRISASARNAWRTFSANIGILPEAGNLYIRIHKLVKSGTAGVTKLFLTKFSTNIQVESEETDIYLYTNAVSSIETTFKGPSFEFGVSDGLILGANGVMEFGSVLTDNWNRAGQTDNLPITSLFLLQWLSFHGYSTALLQGSLYQKGELITPVSTIEDDPSISTKRYILNSWEVSLGSGIGSISYREIPQNDIAITLVSGTRTDIESNEYLIPSFPLPSAQPTQNPALTPSTPTITFDNLRVLNGDVTGDISTAELTPSAIVNKARLDTTGLTGADIVFNAVKDTPDQENMTNLRLSDTYPILDTVFVPYTGAKANTNLGEYGLTTGNLIFDTTPTNIPTGQGAMYWDADDETVALIMNGAIQKVGEDSFYQVKNQTGSNIAKGVAVRFAGTVGNSGRLLIAPFLADGTYPSTYFMGVTMEAINNGEDGKVMWFGRIRGINTNAYNEGDILYASTTVAGGFQTTVPQAPNNIVEICAVVTKSATVGTIFVRPTLGSNINRDEGVKITSGATGDLLQLQTSGLWENKTVASVIGALASKWTSVGSDIYRNSRVLVGGTTFDHSNSILEIQHSTDNYVKGLTIVNSRSWGYGSRITFRVPLASGVGGPADAAAIEQNYDSANNYNLSFYTATSGTLSLKAVLNSGGNLLLGTGTDGGQKLQVAGNVAIRASSTSSPATQIPVFVADPASTTRELVTRTPAQFASDLGLGKKFEQWTKKSAVTSSTNLLVVDKGSASFTTSDLAVGNVYKLRFTIYDFNASGGTDGDYRLKIGGQTYTIDRPLISNEQALINIEFIMICASGADSARVLTLNPILGIRSSVIGDGAYGLGNINYFTPASLTVDATSTLTMTFEGDIINSTPEMVYASCEKIN